MNDLGLLMLIFAIADADTTVLFDDVDLEVDFIADVIDDESKLFIFVAAIAVALFGELVFIIVP